MSEWTPTHDEVKAGYVIGEHLTSGAFPAARYEAEFDRFIARVKAGSLREAIEDADHAGLDAYATNAVVLWLSDRAKRIEREAGL